MRIVRRQAAIVDESLETLSFRNTPAHHWADIANPLTALRVRRWNHIQKIVLQVSGAAPLQAVGGRFRRFFSCLAWGAALRNFPGSILVIEDCREVHGSIGGRSANYLWASASEVQVYSTEDRQALIDAGVSPQKVSLVTPLNDVRARPSLPTLWEPTETTQDAQRQIRRKALFYRRQSRIESVEKVN